MRAKISEALKTALKGGEKQRASTLRMVNAAIQDRDIANRGAGKGPAGDEEILQILTKMVKQRQESAKAFEDGKRPELAAAENAAGWVRVVEDERARAATKAKVSA